jgi:hypothetical protein
VLEETLGRRPVVVRRDGPDTVRAAPGHFHDRLYDFPGVIATGPGEHERAAGIFLDDQFDRPTSLVGR